MCNCRGSAQYITVSKHGTINPPQQGWLCLQCLYIPIPLNTTNNVYPLTTEQQMLNDSQHCLCGGLRPHCSSSQALHPSVGAHLRVDSGPDSFQMTLASPSPVRCLSARVWCGARLIPDSGSRPRTLVSVNMQKFFKKFITHH